MGKWQMVRLGDVCEVLDNLRVPITASERKTGIYPYYGANGIQDYVDNYIFDDELVLLAEDGGNFGSKDKPIAYRVSGKCWVNNHAHVLKPKGMLNVDYLCYSIMFYDVSALISGTTRAKLNQAAMRKITIPLPPLDVQHKIADVLDKASVLIELRRAQLDKLDLLVNSQFIEMFGDPVYNQFGWSTMPINSVCESIVDCPHSTPSYTNENTGYMCIRTSIIKKNQLLWDEIEHIPQHEYKKRIQRREPQKGDIVYSREGAILGIAAIIDRECKIALGQRSMLLSPDKNKCCSEFLCVAMNFDTFLNRALEKVGGSASPHINVGDIKEFQIIVPPLAQQKQFARFTKQVDKSKFAIQQSLSQLERNYKSLMQKCFRGELF